MMITAAFFRDLRDDRLLEVEAALAGNPALANAVDTTVRHHALAPLLHFLGAPPPPLD